MCVFYSLVSIQVTEEQADNCEILCLVRFGSGRNLLVELLIRFWNSSGQTVRSLIHISSGITFLTVQGNMNAHDCKPVAIVGAILIIICISVLCCFNRKASDD